MQRRAAKAAAAAAASASEDNTDEEEAAKPFGGLSMEKSELTADNGQLCEEAAAGGEPAAQKKAAGCLSCKVGDAPRGFACMAARYRRCHTIILH